MVSEIAKTLAPRLTVLLAVAMAAAGCGGGSSVAAGGAGGVTIVVSAPVSTSPWVATSEQNGAELAAAQLNAAGGVVYGGHAHRVTVKVMDDAGSAQVAASIARQAVGMHAVALITDGVGAAAVADITRPASLPVFVVFDGAQSIIDPKHRPTLFRMAPADATMTMRLADYLANRRPRVAILSDDSSYGSDGATSAKTAFHRDATAIVSAQVVPAGSEDVSTQVLAARRAGATTLVVWAGAPVVAAAVTAARQSGWQVPIWTGPTGEDPLVRQRLADHRSWLTGVGFASFRITAEVGPAPFAAYRRAYVARFGEQRIGVDQDGRPVVAPPDWSMFSYDTVNLVAAALKRMQLLHLSLFATLDGNVVIQGANGDERGFSQNSREGVSPDDTYFAVFHGFVFEPVTDDLLSTRLPQISQTL